MAKRIKTLLLPLLMLCATVAIAQSDGSKILGTYRVPSPFNDDAANVKITQCADGTFKGQVVWVNRATNKDGSPRTDEKNPDPKLRSRKPEEIIMCWGLKYEDGEWVGGTLYDPYSGKKFNIKFALDKNGSDLSARYYKGKPALGINGTWKRLR